MKKILLALSTLILILSGCKNNKLNVYGNVTNAKGELLILERIGMSKISLVDTARLDEKGNFSFKLEKDKNPVFYKLRIGNQFITFATCDTISQIKISATAPYIYDNFNISDPINKDVKIISDLEQKTSERMDSIINLLELNKITREDFNREVANCVLEFKRVSEKIILKNPSAPAAYFALFQKSHETYMFNPSISPDLNFFQAVATQWEAKYPDSYRTQNLVKTTLLGIKKNRMASSGEPKEKIKIRDGRDFLNISLPNIYGKVLNLSDLRGKVVLLEFVNYGSKKSQDLNKTTLKLFKKYSNRGFDVFAVSLGGDEHLWKTIALDLPWKCVRDEKGVYSKLINKYNLVKVPTYFLIDKNGDLVARDYQIKNIDKKIENLL